MQILDAIREVFADEPVRGTHQTERVNCSPHRLGSVSYLNARPLTYAIESPITFLPPRRLAAELHAGRLDVALVPLVEVLENPAQYAVVDGVAIGSLDQVYSVFLTHTVPVEKIRTVALDPDSKTSVQLARVLLENFHGLHPHYVDPGTTTVDARVLIGDPAIAFRAENPEAPILDLAGEWHRLTGLPTVFAVWALRRDLPEAEKRQLAAALRRAAALGLAARGDLALNAFEYHYLTEHLCYHLGLEQKKSIQRFQGELARLNLAAEQAELEFV